MGKFNETGSSSPAHQEFRINGDAGLVADTPARVISRIGADTKTPDSPTPRRKIEPWYTDFAPAAGKSDKSKEPHARSLEMVHIPNKPELENYGPLQDVLPGLKRDFISYYSGQRERITAEGMPIKLTPQKAFEQDVTRFVTIVQGVKAIVDKEPHTPLVVMSDLDETAGRLVERLKPIRLPGLPDLTDEKMTPEQKKQLEELNAKSTFDDFVLSPGYIHAINYLHQELEPTPGISFGVSSSKEQLAMSRYLYPRLEQVCPGAFKEMLILSSRNGAMDELVPEVATLLRDPKNTVTLRQALVPFIEHSPPDQRAALQELVDTNSDFALDEVITDFDKKLLLNFRLRQNLITAMEDQYRRGFQETEDGRWTDQMLPAEANFVLIDDAIVPSYLFQDPSLHIISLEPLRLPDDLPIPRVHRRSRKKVKI